MAAPFYAPLWLVTNLFYCPSFILGGGHLFFVVLLSFSSNLSFKDHMFRYVFSISSPLFVDCNRHVYF